MQQTWEELVKTALLGTERQAPPLSNVGDAALEPLLAQFAGADRERALLAAGGVLTLARRAGYLPAAADDATTVAPADLDDLPLCREAAAQDLTRLLDGEYEALLPEWLLLVAAKGQRVPERWLPALLEKGERSKEFRGALLPVLGKRGRWLAAQNPAWHFALQRTLFEADGGDATVMPADLPESVWETGLREERASYLAALRRADPAVAREKLAAVWAQEPYEERAAFLRTLETGLSMADEPFLEATLDDKRKEVRTVAQEFLRALPESGLSRRMADRARQFVTLPKKLEVTLPDAYDKSWARDGIDQKPPSYPKIGEKTFWLTQILAATPLSFWTEHLAQTPEKLIQLAAANKDWREALLESWTRGMANERCHSPWAEPLLNYWLAQKGHIPVAVEWKRVLPKERLEQIAAGAVSVETLGNYGSPVRTLLPACGPVWGRALAERFLSVLKQGAGKKNNNYYFLYAAQEFADSLPEEMLPDLYTVWGQAAGEADYYRGQLRQHAARTEFRREMRRHINGE